MRASEVFFEQCAQIENTPYSPLIKGETVMK